MGIYPASIRKILVSDTYSIWVCLCFGVFVLDSEQLFEDNFCDVFFSSFVLLIKKRLNNSFNPLSLTNIRLVI